MKDKFDDYIKERTYQIKRINQEKYRHHMKSKLKILTNEKWTDFSNLKNLPSNAVGWYSPSDLTAYVKIDNNMMKTIKHEYFGHGLFFENHPIGQMLHYLNQESKIVNNQQLNFSIHIFNKMFKSEIERIAEGVI